MIEGWGMNWNIKDEIANCTIPVDLHVVVYTTYNTLPSTPSHRH